MSSSGIAVRDTATQSSTPTIKPPTEVKTAIVGAGIAGLYCAFRLLEKNDQNFLVAEEGVHLGGRIWTGRVLENHTMAEDDNAPTHDEKYQFYCGEQKVEFCAEFGPMRLELDLQKCLDALLHKKLRMTAADLEPFPPYESPTSEHDPKYELRGEEVEQKTPLDLLLLAVVRVFGRLRVEMREENADATRAAKKIESLNLKLKDMVRTLSTAMATRQPDWKQAFMAWVGTLEESDYQNIREFGVMDDGTVDKGKKGTPLWNMGFWNLLSEVLSHHAVMKLRDLGTFYHLIPENPNAVEWLIFWLRGFRTSRHMVGIRGGMQRITETMVEKMGQVGKDRIKTGFKLTRLDPIPGGKVKLTFANSEEWVAEHVILALPKEPLRAVIQASGGDLYERLRGDLGCVFAFPMLKLFLVVKEKWWDEDVTRTNRYATLIPTREIHYKSSPLTGGKGGMILLYTDSPASAFWANYVIGTDQKAPEYGPPGENPRLISKVLQYLKEYGVTKSADDIPFYAVRDWGRYPYVGANHAWRPERRSWKILEKLSAFPIEDDRNRTNEDAPTKNVHICGEAYSDYHGFIEGALRSAEHIMHRIYPKVFTDTPTEWLCDEGCVHIPEKPLQETQS